MAASKSVLRFIGGSDFADVIVDWTGISRQTVSDVIRDSAESLRASAPDEFRDIHSGDRAQAERLLTDAFSRADKRQLPFVALQGPAALAGLIVQDQVRVELAKSDWTDDQRGYFHALLKGATNLVCRWYLEDQNARGHATGAALGQLLDDSFNIQRQQRMDWDGANETLEDIRTKVEQLGKRIDFAAQAVAASQMATRKGVSVGPLVTDWDAPALGVHASISVRDETSLTPYLPRDHDQQLISILRSLREPNAQPKLLLIVGNSCAGKSRTMYEATCRVLRDWRLIAPKTDIDLLHALAAGVPVNTVVWLDELQERISFTSESIDVCAAIHALLKSDSVGPVLFAGTVWPHELDQLKGRPPADSPTNMRAIPDLLSEGITVPVPDVFNEASIEVAKRSDDPRILKAIQTAAATTHPEPGYKIAQVLAGGTQLVARLYPEPSRSPAGTFSPAASAVLRAAADLRRIGYPNPIPYWALEGVAPAYLDHSTLRPAATWVPAAIEEILTDAAEDDPLLGRNTLDIHTRGVPALSLTWTSTAEGEQISAYNLHDYLTQDHITRHRHTPTKEELWDTLLDHVREIRDIGPLAASAENRGLLSTAIELARADSTLKKGGRVSVPSLRRLARLLIRRSYHADRIELRGLAAAGIPEAKQWVLAQMTLDELRGSANRGSGEARDKLAGKLFRLGTTEALQELRDRASKGDRSAKEALIQSLLHHGGAEALEELRALADAGSRSAKSALALALARRGDQASHSELRDRAERKDEYSLHQLARVGDPQALAKIRSSADSGDSKARRRLMEILGKRDDAESLAELHRRSNPGVATGHHPSGDPYAQQQLATRLRRSGDPESVTELRTRAASGDRRAQRSLVVFLGQQEDDESMDELRHWVYAGVGADSLIWAYRRRGYPPVVELTVEAMPIFRPPSN